MARQTALVSLDPTATRQAAQEIAKFLETSSFELGSWAKEPLHPKTINHAYGCDYNFFDWIFFVSTLNFSFWSDLSQEDRFGIEWQKGLDGKGGSGTTVHTGYASLLAGLARGKTSCFQHFRVENLNRIDKHGAMDCLSHIPRSTVP